MEMEERDQLADSYANNATLANTVLVLLDNLRRAPETRLEATHQRSLDSLFRLLTGTANGAKSFITRSDLSPDQSRSLSQDRLRYGIVRRVKENPPEELEKWTTKAAGVVKRLEHEGYQGISSDDQNWIDTELEPFLDELSKLDSTVLFDDDYEIESQDIAAA
jgi:hypothetical protein